MVIDRKTQDKLLDKVTEAVNGDQKIRRNTPNNLEFIVDRDNTRIENVFGSDDLKVHVKGNFNFGPDLVLHVSGEGIIDSERSKDNVKLWQRKSDGKIGHNYIFSGYMLDLEVQTTRDDYLSALSKFRFTFGDSKFVQGRLRTDLRDGYYDMFAQIRLFKQIAVVDDFIRLGTAKVLEQNQKQLMEKIRELALDDKPVKYETYCESFHGNEFINFKYRTVAQAQYEDPDTGIGFKVTYYPIEVESHYNHGKKSNFVWAVTIPSDTDKKLQLYYNRKFSTPNIDEELRVTCEDLVDAVLPRYSFTGKDVVYFILDNENEFLDCFYRWQNALHIMKYGKPNELSEPRKQLPDVPNAPDSGLFEIFNE